MTAILVLLALGSAGFALAKAPAPRASRRRWPAPAAGQEQPGRLGGRRLELPGERRPGPGDRALQHRRLGCRARRRRGCRSPCAAAICRAGRADQPAGGHQYLRRRPPAPGPTTSPATPISRASAESASLWVPRQTWDAPGRACPGGCATMTMQINAWRWALTRQDRRHARACAPGAWPASRRCSGYEAFIPKAGGGRPAGRRPGAHHLDQRPAYGHRRRLRLRRGPLRASPPGRGWRCEFPARRWRRVSRWRRVLAYLVLSGWPPPAEPARRSPRRWRSGRSWSTARRSACAPWRWQPSWSCSCNRRRSPSPGFQDKSLAATANLVALAELWPHPVSGERSTCPGRSASCKGQWTLASAGRRRRRASWQAPPPAPSPCSTSTGSPPGV